MATKEVLSHQLQQDLENFKAFFFDGRDVPLMIDVLDKKNTLRRQKPSKSIQVDASTR